MSVLILAPENDLHAEAVGRQLNSLKQPFKHWGLKELLKEWNFKFTLSEAGYQCKLDPLTAKGQSAFDLNTFKSIWYRRADQIKSPPLPESWMESMVEWESNRGIEGIFSLLPCLWVNNPLAEQNALLKLRQLEVARQAGLNVPETLVTNDPEAASSFHKEFNGNVIYKFIDEQSCRFMPRYEVPQAMGTMPFRENDLQYLDQIRHSLHLFQRRIEKTSDIRVTIIGKQVFAAEIKSQEGRGKIDFRLDYSVPILKHDLPQETADCCIAVLRHLSLTFGAFDLCRDHTGKYFFLEVNPSGQWLWVEERTGLQISLAVAKLLAGLEAPLNN